jgi:broad specificity phosphatase PhoE
MCFTSGLERARQTAAIAIGERQIHLVELADLNEPAAGEFERGPVSVYNDWVVEKGYWAPNPGGESQVDALHRFLRAFRTVLGSSEDQILVVAHGLPIAWLREGIRPSNDRNADPQINFKDPGVELATRYSFERTEVESGVDALTSWLDRGDSARLVDRRPR